MIFFLVASTAAAAQPAAVPKRLWGILLPTDPWAQAGVILLIAAVAAKVIDFTLTRLLIGLSKRTRTQADDRLLQLLHRPVLLTVFLVGMHLAHLQFELPEPYRGYVQALLLSLAIITWTIFLRRALHLLLEVLARHRQRFHLVQPRTLPLFENAATVLAVGGAAYFLLLAWGANVSGLLASAGVVGLALGLAAKDTLANLFAGLAILADAPFRVGDFIVLETGERGEVTEIGIRSSRIITRDDIEIIVPNSILANSKIINEAGGPNGSLHRIRVRVGVAYGSDVATVRELLLGIAADNPLMLGDPAPRVRFRRMGESSLELELLGWIRRPVERGRTLDQLYTAVHERFAAAGIEIPYPQVDLRVRGELPQLSAGE